jgi:enoyl-CoA hydratase/carnithine racemase
MPGVSLSDYEHAYRHIALERRDGVLLLRLHSRDNDLRWGPGPHEELGRCFSDIAADPQNEIVILTGTGENFIARFDLGPAGSIPPREWETIQYDGRRLLTGLLDVPVPMVAVVNGPATVHAELAVMCDVVIASERAVFQDAPHFPVGLVPSDGVHVVWPLLLGPNRGRHFLLTGQSLSAAEAQRLGVVAEVLPDERLLDRAWQIAAEIRRQPPLTRRFARAVLTRPLKRALFEELPYGLALEGLAAGEHWPAGTRIVPPANPETEAS